MADKFQSHQSGLDSPALNLAAVTPHDTNELANFSRALWVGDITGGTDLKVTTVGGTTETLKGVQAGIPIPVRAKIVFATGTTVASIVALY